MDDSRLSERERFLQCYKRLIGFVFREDNSSRTNIGLLLDELNSIDYSEKFVREEEANELLYHLCRILPLYEKRLLVKVCQSIYNLTAKQQINTRDEVLLYVTKYLIEAIQRSQQWELVEILHAFGAVLYENVGRVSQFHDVLISKDGILMSLILEDAGSEDILRGAVQCVENLTIRVSTQSYMEDVHAMECFKALLKLLHKVPASRIESVTQCKILICCLRGLQNILSTSKIISTNNLGPLLAALRVLMFHGLTTTPMTIPESLNPTPLSQYNIPSTQSPQPTPPAEEQPQEARQKSGKKTRKKKGKKTTENTDKSTDETECGRDSYNTTSLSSSRPSSTATGNNPALRPAWYKVSSSESEYSDSEGGQASRFKSLCGKVRQNVLSCLLAVIKNSEKRVLFGYWSALIPDSGSSGNTHQAQSLIAAILKDPSPKCRMAGLAALTALIDGTKTFLAAASDSEQMNTAFTPFSTVLGSTIRELHRCLLLVLVSENFPLTLTQSIKCLSVLISNVPYHRMKPGLLSRIVKQVRNFLNHRDPNVRVACLTCFGAVAAIQPPMFEICHIIQSPKPGANTDVNQPTTDVNPDISKNKIDSGISSSHSNSPSNSNGLQGATANITLDSGSDSPNVGSSGIETPLFTDRTLQAQAHDVSWLIKLCVKNTLPQSANETGYGGRTDEGQGYVEPLPVRLESLQVLGHLAKGYFPIIRNSLPVLQNLIQVCYCDTDQVVRLHTSKLLDSVTQALLKEVSDTNDSSGTRLTIPQVTDVWLSLLNGPVANELQLESHNAVKATTCDCISNIGPDVFSALPIDKRILCITLILGLTSDEDRIVRSAAVRCLGVFILYPCLREDVSFVADVANAILMLMDDSSLNVRFKTTWSLANLCDALVVNKNENDNDFMEDFSDMLLQKLFTTSIKACQDSDKVKSNAVRALGNIMRYLPSRSLGKSSFRRAVEEGIAALIKNIKSGTMKVRWNACYAVSNMFKNSLLSHDGAEWTKDLLLVLCSVVKDCKNFKVRTNAAIALGTPTQRAHYGEIRLFSSVCESLVVGLQTSEEVTDFAEYRYRSNLNDQLCVSFLHLMTLVDVNDLESMQSMLLEKSAVIAEHFDKFRTSLGEDKTQTESDFQKFKTRLSTLSSENLSTSQQSTVDLLRELLVFDELRNSPERKTEKSAFVQIYD